MLLFRSEQEVERWCRQRGQTHGASFPLTVGWQLAEAWADGRLHPNWQQRPRSEMRALLNGLGLTGEFWALPDP
ncbi:MAG: hypothetical protein IPP47_33755 [Bryobacterales bacterium]|nr:hypothetical protein [Bryobacterales bacterium]